MAKKALITVDSIHRKVKKAFITEKEVYHKARKAFITVGGVYRPCWGGETKIEYYGNGAKLSEAKRFLSGASTKNHAVFAGGRNPTTSDTNYHSTVDAFDKDLVKEAITPLSQARGPAVGLSFKGNAVFIGSDMGAGWSKVDVYDENLVLSTPIVIPEYIENRQRPYVGAVANDTHLLIAGGGNTYATVVDNVDAYDENFVASVVSPLSAKKYLCIGVRVKNKMLLAGGSSPTNAFTTKLTDTVDAYDEDLVKTVAPSMSIARNNCGVASIDGYGILAGDDEAAEVDAYDEDLVLTVASPLRTARGSVEGASTDEHAIFTGGGTTTSLKHTTDADSYDTNLVQTTLTDMKYARTEHAGARVGKSNYVIFAGGEYDSSSRRDTTEIYMEVEI